jgi:hypothetical protein
MSKWLTVVAFALLVLSGAMGLRNVAVAYSAHSGSSLSAQGIPYPPHRGPGGVR